MNKTDAMLAGAGLQLICEACSHSHAAAIRRSLYLGQRTMGDVAAYESGGWSRLAKRLVRRRVTRSLP